MERPNLEEFENGEAEMVERQYEKLIKGKRITVPVSVPIKNKNNEMKESEWTYDYEFLLELKIKLSDNYWGEGLSLEEIEAVLIALDYLKDKPDVAVPENKTNKDWKEKFKKTMGDKNEIVENAKDYAIRCHTGTKHTYNGEPYSLHLSMVVAYAEKYSDLIPESLIPEIISACWTHDVIEDCRQTYNYVKKQCGEFVADITYAVTNEKGKNRKERANHVYYRGIRNTPYADFVKICDRLANTKYSKEKGNMIDVYKKEFWDFKRWLETEQYEPMFNEMKHLLKL